MWAWITLEGILLFLGQCFEGYNTIRALFSRFAFFAFFTFFTLGAWFSLNALYSLRTLWTLWTIKITTCLSLRQSSIYSRIKFSGTKLFS